MIIKNALVFTLDQGFVNKEVKIKNGRFTDEDIVEDTVIDAQGNYLIPGLVDIHFHGCAGHDFSDRLRHHHKAHCDTVVQPQAPPGLHLSGIHDTGGRDTCQCL